MSSLSSVIDWSTGLGFYLLLGFSPKHIYRYLPVPAAWEALEYQNLFPDGHSRVELHNQSSRGFCCLFSRIFKE